MLVRRHSIILGILILFLIIGTILLLSSCGTALKVTSDDGKITITATITDLSNVGENEPFYLFLILKEHTDELTNVASETLGALGSTSLPNVLENTKFFQRDSFADLFEKLRNFTKFEESFKTRLPSFNTGTLDEFIENLGISNEFISKVRNFLQAKDRLLERSDRLNYLIHLDGEVKDDVFNALKEILEGLGVNLQPLSTPTELVFDYRDVLLFSLIFEPLIYIYDNKDQIQENITEAASAIFEDDDMLSEAFLNELTEFSSQVSTISSPSIIQSTDFWVYLKDFIETSAQISPETDVFDMKDIYKEDALIIKGLDKSLDFVDKILKILVELYDYENIVTDDSGYRKDGYQTLWQIVVELVSSAQNILLIKPIGDISVFDHPSTDTTMIIGSVDLTTAKVIDVLREIEKAMPVGKLTIELGFEELKTWSDVLFRFIFDFGGLSQPEYDLKDNNFGVGIEVFNYLATNDNGPNTLEILLSGPQNSQEFQDFETFLSVLSNSLMFMDISTETDNSTLTIHVQGDITIGLGINIIFEMNSEITF